MDSNPYQNLQDQVNQMAISALQTQGLTQNQQFFTQSPGTFSQFFYFDQFPTSRDPIESKVDEIFNRLRDHITKGSKLNYKTRQVLANAKT